MSRQQIQNWYEGEKGAFYQQQARGIPSEAYEWIARFRARKLQPFVSAGDRVLEYGVGQGWNLAALTCARKAGFDIYQQAAATLHERQIEFLPSTSPIEAAAYDVIICHHALEHLPDPLEALEEMLRLLKPGGRLLLFVPFEFERKYRRYTRHEINHHLFSWNTQTICRLVEAAGFTVAEGKIAEFRYERVASRWASRWRLGERGFLFIRKALNLIKPGFEIRVRAFKPEAPPQNV